VGSGFSGMMLSQRLREVGVASVRVYEKGGDVGGTWYWNRYPGCACDIDSHLYSFSFSKELDQDWTWSRRYGRQPEILDYARFVAEKFDLKRSALFWTEVTSAIYDEGQRLWVVRTNRGDCTRARFLFLANGALSSPTIPNIKGVEKFRGTSFHTHDWNHAIDMAGKRVGVIGTGSTATQAIPELAKVVKHLTVFQRTPAYCAPRKDEPMDPEVDRQIKANYQEYRLGRFQATRGQAGGNAGLSDLEKAVAAKETLREAGGVGIIFSDAGKEGEDLSAAKYALGPLNNPKANMRLQEHIRSTIAETVKDPEVAQALTPHYAIGCKRLCITDDYWPTFNRDNVTLVDLKGQSITEVTESGPRGPDGTVYELDALVYATGFEMSGALTAGMDIRGRGGRGLEDKWREGGVSTYLGMLTQGFPNMFIMVGPQSASVLSNMVNAIEHQAFWLCRLVRELLDKGYTEVDADPNAELAWVRHCSDITAKTVWGGVGGGCTSWYTKENLRVDGAARVSGGPMAPHQQVLPYTGGLEEYVLDVKKWAGVSKGLSPPPKGLIMS